MRPKSVVRFELLFLAALGLAVIASAVGWARQIEAGDGMFMPIMEGVNLLIVLAFALLASRRKSNIARWVLVILTLVGIGTFAPHVADAWAGDPSGTVFALVQSLVQVVALSFLFLPDARPWFRKASA